jgi:hypothetical protein
MSMEQEKTKDFKDKCKVCGTEFEAYTEGQLANMIKNHKQSNDHVINQVRGMKNGVLPKEVKK